MPCPLRRIFTRSSIFLFLCVLGCSPGNGDNVGGLGGDAGTAGRGGRGGAGGIDGGAGSGGQGGGMGGFGGEGGSGGDEGPICPDSLELTFGDTPYAYREDGRNFLTFGERVHLRVATERPLPPNAQVAFNAQGSSIGLTPDDKNLGVIFTPDRIETIWIQAKLTCDGKEVQKEFRYFVIYDREKAVFFDPREGDHTAAGTIGEPLRNPQGYLMGLLKENKRRHLYIREGPVDLLGFGFNTQPEFDVGQDPIIVIGGFGRDFDWTRDITSNQTEFVASIEDVLIESGGNPAPAALVFDGISIFLENGRLRCGNGKLWIINSFVDGRIDASPLCDGIAINSTLVSDRLPSIDTAHSLIVGPRPVLPNRFPHPRIWGNVWVIDKPSQEPIAASHLAQSLGGQRGVAASVGSLQTIVELEANTFQYQGDPPSDGAEHLLALNEAFLPLEPNKQAASPCLTPSDHDSWRVPVLDPAADCSLHAPFLTSEEAILRSALRYDLRGIRRGSSVRWRGPLEPEGPSELDGARLEVHLSGDRPSVGEVVRVELDAEGAEIAEWEVEQQLGVDTSVTHGDSAGQFLIHPTTPGGSTWKVRGRIAGTEAWAEAYARLETMPGNRHVFVDPFAESNGDGGPTAPFRDWPDLGSASVENPIDLIVADGLIDPGQSWLPPHVRVFGGYYRSDDLWVRRPIRSRTQVSSPETILIEAGEPTMPAGIRALDQVDIVPGGASPMVRLEGGPLVLSRSRIWSRSPLPPAIHATISLSIGQASANVALVGNTIALQTESAPGFADATPFIQIDAGASL